jgi:hypothetical protein
MSKLTLAKVLAGINYHEDVLLPFYGETVTVRPLSDSEFAMARTRSNLFSIAKELGVSGVSENSEEIDPENSDLSAVDARVSALYLELCKLGIVDNEIRNNVEKLQGGSLAILGAKILELTTATKAETLSFSGAQKVNDS